MWVNRPKVFVSLLSRGWPTSGHIFHFACSPLGDVASLTAVFPLRRAVKLFFFYLAATCFHKPLNGTRPCTSGPLLARPLAAAALPAEGDPHHEHRARRVRPPLRKKPPAAFPTPNLKGFNQRCRSVIRGAEYVRPSAPPPKPLPLPRHFTAVL